MQCWCCQRNFKVSIYNWQTNCWLTYQKNSTTSIVSNKRLSTCKIRTTKILESRSSKVDLQCYLDAIQVKIVNYCINYNIFMKTQPKNWTLDLYSRSYRDANQHPCVYIIDPSEKCKKWLQKSCQNNFSILNPITELLLDYWSFIWLVFLSNHCFWIDKKRVKSSEFTLLDASLQKDFSGWQRSKFLGKGSSYFFFTDSGNSYW